MCVCVGERMVCVGACVSRCLRVSVCVGVCAWERVCGCVCVGMCALLLLDAVLLTILEQKFIDKREVILMGLLPRPLQYLNKQRLDVIP